MLDNNYLILYHFLTKNKLHFILYLSLFQ